MRSPLRLTLTVGAICASLVAVGCGGDDKKSDTVAITTATATTATSGGLASSTYDSIIAGSGKLGQNLTAIGTSISSCSGKATSGVDAVRECIADKLDSANGEIEDLAGTVEDAASSAAGTCKAQLQAFATALRGVVQTFGDGAKEIGGGNVQDGIKAVQNIDVSGLTTSGNAVQTACRPGSTS